MTTSPWNRIQELFEQASERPSEQREEFLNAACADDPALRTEVLSLLEHHRLAPVGFMRPSKPPSESRDLDSASIGSGTPPDVDRLIGTKVGQFQVRQVLAVGGMGTVYEAEQLQPKRTVALKVMRSAIVSRSALKRFEHESQILAALRHPNIAQVYEAGTHRTDTPGGGSVPYFAMEYVPGARPITRYAHEQELGTRERLGLFAAVCDAIHHGHQKGIIHRDLKPGNILVDGEGQAKIIDFGIARSTDSDVATTAMRTDSGQLLGTLQYMSPEQCEADPLGLDVRTDVYSLGVVLYELLCGELPYDVTHTTIVQAARVICEQPPARPRTVSRKIRGDLELILLRALEKDRRQRYQSVHDLARDIRHYLNREPVEASPPSIRSISSAVCSGSIG